MPTEVDLAEAMARVAGIVHGRDHLELDLMAIQIGSIVLLSMPSEPFPEIAIEIASASPFPHTLFSGYSNGIGGYVPVREAFSEGGYEVEITPFSPKAGELIVRESLALLGELSAEGWFACG